MDPRDVHCAIKCASKVGVYGGREQALQASLGIESRGGPVMRPYRCPECSSWHLTRLRGGEDRQQDTAVAEAKPGWRPARPSKSVRAGRDRREQELLRGRSRRR